MKRTWPISIVLLCIMSCDPDPATDMGIDLTKIVYAPEDYPIVYPSVFPNPPIVENNAMTKAGVQLGRHLFYDPILSSDSTMSCSSCHNPKLSFTDGLATSKGVLGQNGTRSSMSIMNSVYSYNGLFWDGRSNKLENQAALPVEDRIELHEKWSNVENKLRRSEQYRELFRKAFGISNSKEITQTLATKAIAQFERILVTGQNSIFTRFKQGKVALSSDQQDGHDMFFNLEPALPDAECNHCHAAPLMTTASYFNNGLDSAANYREFKDVGRGAVSLYQLDTGRFKAPSLFNIALTAPYMHDGRFKTIEQVVEHYDSGGHGAPNKDNFIRKLGLSARQKKQLVSFLKTLTDTSYYQNPDFFSPF